jgi:hypothetical protein
MPPTAAKLSRTRTLLPDRTRIGAVSSNRAKVALETYRVAAAASPMSTAAPGTPQPGIASSCGAVASRRVV